MNRIAAVTVVALGLLVAGCSGDNPDDATAEVMCQDFVKDQLKAPGSAKFSEERADEPFDGEWKVTGVVDSENGFGALLRAEYTCRMTHDDGEWTADEVTVVPQ